MSTFANMDDWSRLKAQYPTWQFWISSSGSLYTTRRRGLSQNAMDFGLAETISAETEEQLEKKLKAQVEVLRAFELNLI